MLKENESSGNSATTGGGKPLPAYQAVQRKLEMLLRGIRWRMEPDVRMKSVDGKMYYINRNGTVLRHTPRTGKKTKRTCSVERLD